LFATGLSIVMGVAVLVFAGWIANDASPNQQPETLIPTIRWFALAVPLSVLGGVLSAGLQGSRLVKKSLTTQNIVVPGIRLVVFAVLALFGMKLFGLVFALLASFLFGLFYAGWHLLNGVEWMRRGLKPDYSEWKQVAVFSFPLILL